LAEKFEQCFASNDLMSAVKLIVGPRNNYDWAHRFVLAQANRGVHVIVLDKTAPVARRIAAGVRRVKEQNRARQKTGDTSDQATTIPIRNTVSGTRGRRGTTASTGDERQEDPEKAPIDPFAESLDRYIIEDAPNMKAEDVISRLTMKLTRNAAEFGFQAAEEQRISAAWGNYFTYVDTARKHEIRAMLLHTVAMILDIAIVLVSCSIASALLDGGETTDVMTTTTKVLPVCMAFVVSANTMLKPQLIATNLRSGAAEVLGEIYKYRGRAGEYRHERGSSVLLQMSDARVKPGPPSHKDNSTNASGEQHVKPSVERNTRALPREVFKNNLSEIHSSLLSGVLNSASLDRSVTKKELYKRVLQLLKTGVAAGTVARETEEERDDEHGHDDHGFSPISGRDYVEHRLKPAIASFSAKAPRLARLHEALNTLVLLFVGMTSVLSFLGHHVWLPAGVAGAFVVNSTVDFLNLKDQVRKTNSSLVGLQNQLVWWHTLAASEKRKKCNIDKVIETAEMIILHEQSSMMPTRAAQATKTDDGDNSKEHANASHHQSKRV
jgi:hypothetical protein